MSVLKVALTTQINKETLRRNYERSVSAKYPTVQSISDLIISMLGGSQLTPSVAVSIQDYETQASGTFVLTSVVATDIITINGVSFTAVASGATGNQFNVGVNDNATAENLAAAINASVTALVSGYVTAAKTTETASPATVTVTSAFYGVSGNQTTIASADSTIVASGARLTGGAPDSSAKTYTF